MGFNMRKRYDNLTGNQEGRRDSRTPGRTRQDASEDRNRSEERAEGRQAPQVSPGSESVNSMAMLTTIDRHRNLDDAREILLLAAAKTVSGGQAQRILYSAIDKNEEAMRVLEFLLADDPGGFCQDCKLEVEDAEAHNEECHAEEVEHDSRYGPNSGVSIQ